MKFQTDDLRIIGMHELCPPVELHGDYPLTETATETVYAARQGAHRILHGDDDRLRHVGIEAGVVVAHHLRQKGCRCMV